MSVVIIGIVVRNVVIFIILLLLLYLKLRLIFRNGLYQSKLMVFWLLSIELSYQKRHKTFRLLVFL